MKTEGLISVLASEVEAADAAQIRRRFKLTLQSAGPLVAVAISSLRLVPLGFT
ncbi:MAG: hypothetical protein ACLPWG_05050 [Steroidobacteraceae bacterium]